jgi:membrane protease YdiL (CAAX protease family)
MSLDPTVTLTFGALALAVLLLWVPFPVLAGRCPHAWPSAAALALACAFGLAGGLLDWRAPVAILAYAAVAIGARDAPRTAVRVPLLVVTGLAAFLFALHRIPGFHNAVIADAVRFSSDAAPYRLRLNVDTAVTGIVLMAVFCRPIRTAADWRAMLARTWPVVLSVLVVVLGLGWAMGYVRPDVKWTPYSAAFLAANLLFTCVTEEAFFRGFLLRRIADGLAVRFDARAATVAAVMVSTLLFGLAHAAGGAALVVLATVAGLHYALAYLRSGRIEGAILTHFALNAVHFLAFTYPALTAAR